MSTGTYELRPGGRAFRACASLLLSGTLALGCLTPADAFGQAGKSPSGGSPADQVGRRGGPLDHAGRHGPGLGEWGFAALVEADGQRTPLRHRGRPETVLKNARELGVELGDVTDVVLSHHHGDHTGGCDASAASCRGENPKALSLALRRRRDLPGRARRRGEEYERGVGYKRTLRGPGGLVPSIDRPTQIFPGAWLTGPGPADPSGTQLDAPADDRRADGSRVEDNVPEDMSLVLDTEKGLVVVSGLRPCGRDQHAGIRPAESPSRPGLRGLGGFHLFQADAATLDWTARMLGSFEIKNLLGAHCTGIEAVFGLRRWLGLDRKTCAVGAVGARFSLQSGLDPGRIAR